MHQFSTDFWGIVVGGEKKAPRKVNKDESRGAKNGNAAKKLETVGRPFLGILHGRAINSALRLFL